VARLAKGNGVRLTQPSYDHRPPYRAMAYLPISPVLPSQKPAPETDEALERFPRPCESA
jgi:hypothetical protein